MAVPAGRGLVLVIEMPVMMVRLKDLVNWLPAPSVTVTGNVSETTVVGVPAKVPALDSVSPAGIGPVVVNVYGGTPPDALKVKLYRFPVSPLPKGEVLLIVSVANAVEGMS